MHVSDRGEDTAAWLLSSGFSSEHDTLQNWIREGLLSVMSAGNRIENIYGTDRDREHKTEARDGQKKGERGLQRKVGQWDRGVSDWTEEGESVPGSVWCPHSVPAASSSSHQLNTSQSHFDEINTHTQEGMRKPLQLSWWKTDFERRVCSWVWKCALCSAKVKSCWAAEAQRSLVAERKRACGRRRDQFRSGSFLFLSSPKWQSVGVFMI